MSDQLIEIGVDGNQVRANVEPGVLLVNFCMTALGRPKRTVVPMQGAVSILT